jgi:hypothetical protein
MSGYGGIVASDFVHLLENFSGPIAPVYPIQGQLWYKNDTKEAFLYDAGTFVGQQLILNGLSTTDLDVNFHKITNVSDPTNPGDAVNLTYFTTNALTIAGTVMNPGASIAFSGGGTVTGLPAVAVALSDATSKAYVDAQDTTTLTTANTYTDTTAVSVVGDTMTGTLIIDGTLLYSSGNSASIVSFDSVSNTITITGDATTSFTALKKFNADLFAPSGYQKVDVGGGKILASPTGLANDGTHYTAQITTDGVDILNVDVIGSSAQTYTGLLAGINSNIAGFAVVSLVDSNLQITAVSTGVTSSVSIVDNNLFNTLTGYSSILAAVPGYAEQTGVFTVVSSSHDIPTDTTSILVTELILATSTPGATSVGLLTPILGLTLTNGAATLLDGDVAITGARSINMGNNVVKGVSTPIAPTDAVNKDYFDSNVVPISSVAFADNTLTITTSTNVVSTGGIANEDHLHVTSEVTHNASGSAAVDSYFRDTFRDQVLPPPNPAYPAVTSSSILNAIDQALYQTTSPNDRLAYVVASEVVSDVSLPYSSAVKLIVNHVDSVSGNQIVDVGGAITGASATGLGTTIPATSGHQDVNVGGAITGASATGLTNDATVYTATITIDGVANPVSVVGSAAQTYATLLTEINNDLTVLPGISTLVGGNLRVSSVTTGITSTVAIADTDLFSSLTDYVSILAAVDGTDAIFPTYTANITVDGVLKPISIFGNSSQLYSDLLIAINDDLGASAVATISGGNIKITSATAGPSSTVSIVDVDLFSSLTTFSAILAATPGTYGSYTIAGGDLTANFTVGVVITISGNTGVPANTAHTVVSSSFNVGPNTTTIVVLEPTDPATTNDGVIGSSVVAVVVGAGGSYTISGGDFTQTFKPGLKFSVNDGVSTLTYFVSSSAFNPAGPFGLETTITVMGTVPLGTLAVGYISSLYGAFQVVDDVTSKYTSGVRFNLSANTNAPSNGDYVTAASTIDPSNTYVWIYTDSTAPVPALTAGDGEILPYTISLPFPYYVEYNKLQLYVQGIKQYNSTRGYSAISIPVTNDGIVEWMPTNLAYPATYSFDVEVDGGPSTTVDISISYVLGVSKFSIVSVDLVNNSWTISGASSGYFDQFMAIEVVDNVGLGATASYTVISYSIAGPNTTVVVAETIAGTADASGTAQKPHTFATLVRDIQLSLASEYPTVATRPQVNLRHGKLQLWSPTNGTGSSVTVTDSTLFAALGVSSIYNSPVGIEYGYKELGSIFQQSNLIDLVSLPTPGYVYECILVG